MDWSKILAALLSGVSGAVIGVLHASGADKHRTVAGDVAKGMAIAAAVAQAVHDSLSSEVSPPQVASAPDASNTP